jgi:hypothetical protein
MATSIVLARVSQLFVRRFLRLAAEAESHADYGLARARYLLALRHDATPGAGLEFARFLVDSGQHDDARLVLHDCWQLAKRRSRHDEIATCCRRLALSFQRKGNSPLARRFLQRAADAEMSSWVDHEAGFSAEQLVMESQFAERDGDTLRAFALCRAAIDVAEGRQRVIALRQWARLQAARGQRRAAAHDLLAAARHARQAAEGCEYAECLLELGHLLRSMQRGKLAIDCFKAAATQFRKAGRTVQSRLARRWVQETAAIEHMAGGDGSWN